jgi:hypothetical protein
MRMKYKLIGLSLGLLGTALWATSVCAQGRAAAVFTATSRNGMGFGRGAMRHGLAPIPGRFSHSPRHRFRYAYPGYGPYFYYPDYDYEEGTVEAPPPPVRAAAQPAALAENSKPADSVVMELRGDHWVRLTSTGPVEVVGKVSPAGAPSGSLSAFDPTPAAQPLPAAVLVFRDGHREEAAKYTIVGGIIYLKADYWTTGSWTRKIRITDLDVRATLKANIDRGTKFSLPSRSSEVILRP